MTSPIWLLEVSRWTVLSLTVTVSVRLANLQRDVQQERAVGVEDNSSAAVGAEAGMVYLKNVVADGKNGESVGAPGVGGGGLPDVRADVDQNDGSLATAAPDGSVTVPEMLPPTPAKAVPRKQANKNK